MTLFASFTAQAPKDRTAPYMPHTIEEPSLKANYLQFRNRHIPTRTKIIFVLESPPASGRYFYNPDGPVSEPLFRPTPRYRRRPRPRPAPESSEPAKPVRGSALRGTRAGAPGGCGRLLAKIQSTHFWLKIICKKCKT